MAAISPGSLPSHFLGFCPLSRKQLQKERGEKKTGEFVVAAAAAASAACAAAAAAAAASAVTDGAAAASAATAPCD